MQFFSTNHNPIFVNLKIHRIYCKYHYLEGHEFKTPEEELRHFLKKMGDPDWKWTEQYENDANDDEESQERKLNFT